MSKEHLPKYAHMEIERRWLVDLAAVDSLENLPYRIIEDVYLPGTGLRLRKMVDPAGTAVFKLCKKYGKSSTLSEAMTNLYLTGTEHALLRACLKGTMSVKRRYSIEGGSIDVYGGGEQVAVFELEFASEAEAAAYVPPAFAVAEITGDPRYSGAALAARQGVPAGAPDP